MTTIQESIERENKWTAVEDDERLEELFENDLDTMPVSRPTRFKAFGIAGFRSHPRR